MCIVHNYDVIQDMLNKLSYVKYVLFINIILKICMHL